MTALRSQRLETLLGARLDDARHEHFEAMVQTHVSEAFDLDFKRQHYGNADKDRRELAGDVAALANSAGGMLVLGIEEDEHAHAVAAPVVTVSDGEIRRIHQVIAEKVAPIPVVDVRPVPDPAVPGRGFLVIAVPHSPRAPHAVVVNEGLRFPVRHGTTTRYMPESEVATAYRERFARARSQSERAAAIEAKAHWRLANAEDHCWVINLTGAQLGHANLTRADLRYANLTGAQLGGAQLGRADLTGARLGANPPAVPPGWVITDSVTGELGPPSRETSRGTNEGSNPVV